METTSILNPLVVIIGILCVVILILGIIIKKMVMKQSTAAARVSEKNRQSRTRNEPYPMKIRCSVLSAELNSRRTAASA